MQHTQSINLRLCFLLFVTGISADTQAAVMYDASTNTLPHQQGWFFLTSPLLGANASQGVADGMLTLDTLQHVSEQAGYFSGIPVLGLEHPDLPLMDLNESAYSIEFSMLLVAGRDLPDTDPLAPDERNRGGFAVIAISEDLTGIELQFQMDQIIALDDTNAAFPIGEGRAFDTTNAHYDYQLLISTEGYQLSVDGTTLLAGPIRNYSTIAPSGPVGFPYRSPSFLFFGDNTGRGGAVTQVSHVAVSVVGDCNHDDDLNAGDLLCVDMIQERDVVLNAINTIPGDLDGNGDVAFKDFLTLAQHFGAAPAAYVDGNIDVSMDGVTFTDFLLLAESFGFTNHAVTVAEPRSNFMCCPGILAVFIALRLRRRHKLRDR
jgi:hypothetical protein